MREETYNDFYSSEKKPKIVTFSLRNLHTCTGPTTYTTWTIQQNVVFLNSFRLQTLIFNKLFSYIVQCNICSYNVLNICS